MRGVIIYRSRYGSTRQYAEWLQEETGFDLFDVKQAPRDLGGYDVVVLGASVLAGRLTLADWIRAHWPALQGKTVLLFFTHADPDPQATAQVVPQSLPPAIADAIRVFPVGGRYMLGRMSFLDRTMIKTVAALDKRPEVKEQFLRDHDHVRREDLDPLVDEIRRLAPDA